MLKRIKRHQVCVGMFITDIEDPLRDEARPVRAFLLKDQSDVAKVKSSNVISVVIDTARGTDVDGTMKPRPLGTGLGQQSGKVRAFSDVELKHAMETIEQTKPLLEDLFSDIRLSGTATFEHADIAVDQIAQSMENNPAALIGITRLKNKDEYTFLHSISVSALMVHFGRSLRFDEQSVRGLGMAGLLHDIGKMLVPDSVLSKKGALSDAEHAQIRLHPIRGYELLSRQGGMPEVVLDVCLHHHERMDGKGYPHGLKDGQLSIAARIAAICDVYDAMTSVRPYKRAWTPTETMKMMLKSDGHFDRRLLGEFIASLRGPAKSAPHGADVPDDVRAIAS